MIHEEITFIENEIDRLHLDLRKLQNELIYNDFTYYHGHDGYSDLGTKNELYHFWVYPPTMKLGNKWDTHLSSLEYCNNHRVLAIGDHHWYAKENGLKQCVCLGHSSIDDFKNAREEWTKENITRPDIGIYMMKHAKPDIKLDNDAPNESHNNDLHEALKPIVKENLTNMTLFILGSLLLLMFLILYQPRVHKMVVLSSRDVDL